MTELAVARLVASPAPITLRLAVRDMKGITKRNLANHPNTAATLHDPRTPDHYPLAVPLRARRGHPCAGGR